MIRFVVPSLKGVICLTRNLIMIVGLVAFGIIMTGCAMTDESQVNAESKNGDVEKVNDIMENMVGHHKGYFDQLPNETKQFMKDNPNILQKYSKGDPIFMDAVSRFIHDVTLKPNDIQFLYDKLVNQGRDYYIVGNGKNAHMNPKIEQTIKNN